MAWLNPDAAAVSPTTGQNNGSADGGTNQAIGPVVNGTGGVSGDDQTSGGQSGFPAEAGNAYDASGFAEGEMDATTDGSTGVGGDVGVDGFVDIGGETDGSAVGDAATSAPIVPCPGANTTLVVAADGTGQYTTVQAAINSIASNNAQLVEVKVKADRYQERVNIDKPFVCLVGESAETTIITNTAGTNIKTSGTVIVGGNDFSAANITFENSAPDGAGQAVALMAQGQRQQFYNCRFVSYQDTLFAYSGTQYFKNCYIQGDTDYIFGAATSVFDECTINNVADGTAVTAPNTLQSTAYGFVFIGGSLTADPTTSTVRTNHVFLGRAWGQYAAAAFINVEMGAHISEDGWSIMPPNSLTLAGTRFWEYESTGAGANTTSSNRSSRQLSDAEVSNYTVENVLKPWVPGYYK